jgi:hypothetical protein
MTWTYQHKFLRERKFRQCKNHSTVIRWCELFEKGKTLQDICDKEGLSLAQGKVRLRTLGFNVELLKSEGLYPENKNLCRDDERKVKWEQWINEGKKPIEIALLEGISLTRFYEIKKRIWGITQSRTAYGVIATSVEQPKKVIKFESRAAAAKSFNLSPPNTRWKIDCAIAGGTEWHGYFWEKQKSDEPSGAKQ